jgi:hypothetical protein
VASDLIADKLTRQARASLEGGKKAWQAQSTSERLSVAILLDRPDWIKSMGYSLGGAITRIGPEWLARFPAVMDRLELP